jgi:hypothetical protein
MTANVNVFDFEFSPNSNAPILSKTKSELLILDRMEPSRKTYRIAVLKNGRMRKKLYPSLDAGKMARQKY